MKRDFLKREILRKLRRQKGKLRKYHCISQNAFQKCFEISFWLIKWLIYMTHWYDSCFPGDSPVKKSGVIFNFDCVGVDQILWLRRRTPSSKISVPAYNSRVILFKKNPIEVKISFSFKIECFWWILSLNIVTYKHGLVHLRVFGTFVRDFFRTRIFKGVKII